MNGNERGLFGWRNSDERRFGWRANSDGVRVERTENEENEALEDMWQSNG